MGTIIHPPSLAANISWELEAGLLQQARRSRPTPSLVLGSAAQGLPNSRGGGVPLPSPRIPHPVPQGRIADGSHVFQCRGDEIDGGRTTVLCCPCLYSPVL